VATWLFECPFYKQDPRRYLKCRGCWLSRLSDVMQHISRQHRVLEVTLGSGESVRVHDIVLYCTRCRHHYHGMGASRKRDIHMNQGIECEPANIEQSGVMLDGEFEALRIELRSYSRRDETFRWNIIWKRCFPEKPCPPSPYVDVILPRADLTSELLDFLESPRDPSQDVHLVVGHLVDRIYNTLPDRRKSSSVLPQTQSNIIQTASVSNYGAPISMSAHQASNPQPLQPRTQGFGYRSGLPNAGVHTTPNTFINNSAPSPVPGFGPHELSANNFIPLGYYTVPSSGYPPVPYIEYPTGPFEAENEDDEYLDTPGNTTGRRGPQC
jgi:hypothetical protein